MWGILYDILYVGWDPDFLYLGLSLLLLFYQDIDRYNTFYMLPRDISQQIFNELVYSQHLTDVSLKAFRDCAIQV